jgi:hypothetical protein
LFIGIFHNKKKKKKKSFSLYRQDGGSYQHGGSRSTLGIAPMTPLLFIASLQSSSYLLLR